MPALRTPAVVSHSQLLYQCKLPPSPAFSKAPAVVPTYIHLSVSCTRLALVQPLSVISPPHPSPLWIITILPWATLSTTWEGMMGVPGSPRTWLLSPARRSFLERFGKPRLAHQRGGSWLQRCKTVISGVTPSHAHLLKFWSWLCSYYFSFPLRFLPVPGGSFWLNFSQSDCSGPWTTLTPSLGPDLLNFRVWPQCKGQQFIYFFLNKGQLVNILGFVVYMASVTTIQLCHCSGKAAIKQYVNKLEFQ